MKKYLINYLILLVCCFVLLQSVNAENIHFNNDIYDLKYSNTTQQSKIIENEYFRPKENKDYWTSLIGIYYYPEVSNPLKFASDSDAKIESKENFLLLKFVQNKKQNVAVISYLENIAQNDKTYFIYNIYKYEKHPKKGMMVLRFAKKYVFNTKDEITQIGHEVKNINNEYMNKIIVSPIPPIVK